MIFLLIYNIYYILNNIKYIEMSSIYKSSGRLTVGFEEKYRLTNKKHINLGVINPLHKQMNGDQRKDINQKNKQFCELQIRSVKVEMKAKQLSNKRQKNNISEDLKQPFVYIKQVVHKKDQSIQHSDIYNCSNN